jgi:hypothetical protein
VVDEEADTDAMFCMGTKADAVPAAPASAKSVVAMENFIFQFQVFVCGDNDDLLAVVVMIYNNTII